LKNRAGAVKWTDVDWATFVEERSIATVATRGGIDRPLALHKEGRRSIIPHQDWRGQFARGTYAKQRRADGVHQLHRSGVHAPSQVSPGAQATSFPRTDDAHSCTWPGWNHAGG
jgi:hypothetical protein